MTRERTQRAAQGIDRIASSICESFLCVTALVDAMQNRPFYYG